LDGLFQDEDVIFAALIIRLNFALSYPSWFVLLCLAAGALFSSSSVFLGSGFLPRAGGFLAAGFFF
jgi:hypothetical protein